MARYTQPVVYQPTNPTKYIDAYTQRVVAEKQAAAQVQRERDKERKKLYDELGMYSDLKYTSPVYQRAYDEKLKEFKDSAMSDLDNFGKYLKEFEAYTKKLNAEDEKVSSAFSNYNKSRETYRNPDEFETTFMQYDVGEDFDPNDLGTLVTQATNPFGVLNKKFDVGNYVASEGNKILKNLAADPESASEYFDEYINTRDIGQMNLTQIFKKVKPNKRQEVMDIIISSNDQAAGQVMWDYSRGIENPDEAYENAISGATEDMFSLLGIAPLERTLKNTKDDERERRGGLTLDGEGYRNDLFGFTVSKGKTNEGGTLTDKEGRKTKYKSLPSVGGVVNREYTFIMPREIYKDSDLVELNWYDEDGETIRGRIDQIREYEDGTRTILITSRDYGTVELPFSQDNISKLKNLEISEADVSTMFNDGPNKAAETQSRETGGAQGGSGPKIGEVRMGPGGSKFEFIGGDSRDRDNWKRVN